MEDQTSEAKPIEILFSYTREDEYFRNRIEVHLAALKRQKRIVCWHDRHIHAGRTWSLEISQHLDSADIILLLVSPDFVNSDYCNTVEVRRALERHEKGEVCVIPIILQSADWKGEKFAELQALPRDAHPIADWPDPEKAFYDVAIGIKRAVEDIEKARNR
jgi:hypothetical protein